VEKKMPKLEVKNFSAKLDGELLYSNVSLCFESGVIGLCGPSGVGKSTLLLKIVGLISSQSTFQFTGEVFLGGLRFEEYAPRNFRRLVCLLPQHPVVFPGSIQENVLLGAQSHGFATRLNSGQLSEELLRKVGLWEEVKHKLNQPAHELSLGQKQRLCLARALGVQPEFLLLDEPTASLDTNSQKLVEETLLEFSKEKGVLLVTHNSDQRERMCGSCLELYRGGECVLEASSKKVRSEIIGASYV
jgi:phosphate transport system ATP-binding protein